MLNRGSCFYDYPCLDDNLDDQDDGRDNNDRDDDDRDDDDRDDDDRYDDDRDNGW